MRQRLLCSALLLMASSGCGCGALQLVPPQSVAARAAPDSAGPIAWPRFFGAPKWLEVAQVVRTAEGELWVAGEFGGALELGDQLLRSNPGKRSGFLARFDQLGTPVWSRVLRGRELLTVAGVAGKAQGGALVSGSAYSPGFESDETAFLLALAPSGEEAWRRTWSGLEILDVAADEAGNSFVSAGFSGTVRFEGRSFSGGREEQRGCIHTKVPSGLVFKLDERGGLVWTEQLEDAYQYLELAVGGSEVFLAGPKLLALDASGNERWTLHRTLGPKRSALVADGEGGLVLAESKGQLRLTRFDPNGKVTWSRAFGASRQVPALALEPDGSLLLGADFSHPLEQGALVVPNAEAAPLVARLKASGEPVAGRGFPESHERRFVLPGLDGKSWLVTTRRHSSPAAGAESTGDELVLDQVDWTAPARSPVIRSAPDGLAVWSKPWGGKGSEFLSSLVSDGADGVFVSGSFQGDLEIDGGTLRAGSSQPFAARLDGAGSASWRHAFGFADLQVHRVTADSSGRVFVGGATGAEGAVEAVVAQVDPKGGWHWKRALPIGSPRIAAMAVDADNRLFVAGTGRTHEGIFGAFVARLDADGELLWTRHFAVQAQVPNLAVGEHGVVVGAFREGLRVDDAALQSAYGQEGFAVALDEAGRVLWHHQLGGRSGEKFVDGACFDQKGNVYLSGSGLEGDYEGLALIKLDAQGHAQWKREYELVGERAGLASSRLALGSDGDLVVAGAFAGEMDLGGGVLRSAGSADLFVARFSSEGDHRWSAAWGGAGEQQLTGLVVLQNGDLVLGGSFHTWLDFGLGRRGRIRRLVARRWSREQRGDGTLTSNARGTSQPGSNSTGPG